MPPPPPAGDARPGCRLARLAAQPVWVSLLLAAATLMVFYPVVRFQFVSLDDSLYVTANAHVQQGLTLDGTIWALRSGYGSNWHPLTWLSHMLDVQLYGLNPAGHHLTNLLFHIANTVLLFLVLRRATRSSNVEHPTSNPQHRTSNLEPRTSNLEPRTPLALNPSWLCAVVAALFALHPLHVESVAWISERKDVLSGLFFLLTLWAYVRYVQSAECGVRSAESGSTHHAPRTTSIFYFLALAFFALGLMSKPMLVTLPFVLLLLDYWPLGRLSFPSLRHSSTPPLRLVLEKLPFFALSAASSAVTCVVQHAGGAVMSVAELSLSGRIANALVSYPRYLAKLLWPANLACFYPRPEHWPAWQVACAALVLAAITLIALRLLPRHRYLAVGWFWFVGTLVPVIGLVQVGEQAMADRYTYLPAIGFFVLAAWGLGELAGRWRRLTPLLTAGSVLVLATLLLATRLQLTYWQTSETLFRHALAVTRDNPWVHCLLANTLADAGDFAEAEAHCREALRLKPGFPEIEILYANVLAQGNKTDEAIALLSNLLRQNPADPDTRLSLASVLGQKGDVSQAIEHYRAVLSLKPDSAEALNNLAWIRAASAKAAFRNGEEAVRLASRACELTGRREPVMLGTLAAAYAAAGRFDDAVATAQEARGVALARGQNDLAQKNQALLELYQSRRPYHESPEPSPGSPARL